MNMQMSGFDDDDFFGGGVGGGMGNFSSFQSSSFSGGMGGGGMGESISQQTVYENGRQKTITTKTKMDSRGNKTTEVIEETTDPRTGRTEKVQYIENGSSNQRSNGGRGQ